MTTPWKVAIVICLIFGAIPGILATIAAARRKLAK